MDTRGTVVFLYDHGHQSTLSPVNRGTEQAEIWQHRLRRFDTVMDEDYENLEPIQRSMEFLTPPV